MTDKRSDVRMTVLDPERILRDQAEALALKRIYGTNISDVIRTLVALAYVEHYGDRTPADVLGRVE
jgi:alkyl hydroperoxide reductase subunit AhpC